jgi:hypothetical protein
MSTLRSVDEVRPAEFGVNVKCEIDADMGRYRRDNHRTPIGCGRAGELP